MAAKGSQHGAGDSDRVLFFHPAHHHAEMSRFDDDSDAVCAQLITQCFSDLDRQSFLHLESPRKRVDDPRNLAETDDFLIRQVADMYSAEKGEQVVFTHTEKIDVLDDHHFVVFDRKQRTVQ